MEILQFFLFWKKKKIKFKSKFLNKNPNKIKLIRFSCVRFYILLRRSKGNENIKKSKSKNHTQINLDSAKNVVNEWR